MSIGICAKPKVPDGKLLYSRNEGMKVNFQLADADGKNPRPVSTDLGWIYNPVPSLDGKYIVFSSKISQTPRIWRIDADGKNPFKLTEENTGYGDFNPQVTTDGKTVIFQRQSNGEEHAELMKMSIEGGQAETFYSNAQADTSGYGEGATYLGTVIAVTDGNGFSQFTFTSATPVSKSSRHATSMC